MIPVQVGHACCICGGALGWGVGCAWEVGASGECPLLLLGRWGELKACVHAEAKQRLQPTAGQPEKVPVMIPVKVCQFIPSVTGRSGWEWCTWMGGARRR